MKKNQISLVIPCLNEAKRLPYTLELIEEFNEKYKLIKELILVIEPSADGTLDFAKRYASNHSFVKIIENEHRLGKGGSVRKGMLNAENAYIAFTDADGSVHLDFLYEATTYLNEKFDIVIASRSLKNSKALKRRPLNRIILGKFFSSLVKKTFKMKIEDTQCGCKMFKKEIVPSLFKKLGEKGFAFDLEILLKANNRKYKIKEIGCIWEDKEGSTVNPLKDSINIIKSLYRLNIRNKRKEL